MHFLSYGSCAHVLRFLATHYTTACNIQKNDVFIMEVKLIVSIRPGIYLFVYQLKRVVIKKRNDNNYILISKNMQKFAYAILIMFNIILISSIEYNQEQHETKTSPVSTKLDLCKKCSAHEISLVLNSVRSCMQLPKIVCIAAVLCHTIL